MYIPCTVAQNARISFYTGRPETPTATDDPAAFTPTFREEVTLPQPHDSTQWRWSTPWTVIRSRHTDEEGWTYARSWDCEWTNTYSSEYPLARRTWLRLMQKYTILESEPGPRKPRRRSSLGTRLLDLVVGHSRPQSASSHRRHPSEAVVTTDESEVEEVFSVHTQSLHTPTPASSLHEEPTYIPTVPTNSYATTATQSSTHYRRHTPSSSFATRPPTTDLSRRPHRPSRRSNHDNDENRPPEENPSIQWEADDQVQICRLCNRRFTAFLRRHHCRYCGRVVCHRCSGNLERIPPERVVRNPFVAEQTGGYTVHRVCDSCVSVLRQPAPQQTMLVVETTPAQQIQVPQLQEDDRYLIECPVCRTDLRQFGDEELQAIHVATCLEEHTVSRSFSGGSRHLGTPPQIPETK
jgi:FYVE zinc finger